jgi:Na+/melibiose symporter-like transporter
VDAFYLSHFVINAIAVVIFIFILTKLYHSTDNNKIYLAFCALWFLSTLLNYILFGIGQTWDFNSFILKLFAVAITIAVPLLLSLVPFLMIRKWPKPIWVGVGFSAIGGFVGILSMPFLDIILVCMFTGDCL